MKYSKIILVLLISLLPFSAFAESDGTTITISSNVELPVTCKPNGRSAFSIYQRSYTTTTRIADATFTDGRGRRCMSRHSTAHTGGNVHHYYEITGVYSSSSSYNGNSSSNNSNSSFAEAGRNLTETVVTGMSIPCKGHPFLAFGAGLSKSCGEFARIKFVTGGVAGIVLSASIGKDWIFKEDYADKLSWNAGFGLRFGDPNTDISINILLGRTPWHKDIALITNLELEHYFGDARRFGVFGNIGVAATNMGGDGKAKAYFDFSVGVAFKLWQR